MADKMSYDGVGNGLWGLFARVKYWAAKKSPRAEGQRPKDLQRAAEMLRDALEMCWRAGYKGEQLVEEMKRLTR
jgi:hypothetical protein